TCINILCGLVVPDSGAVFIFEKNCLNEAREIQKIIGVVPQQIALFPEMTAWENLRYIGRLYGLTEKLIQEKAGSLLEKLRLTLHANKRIGRYSGGMKRRINIIASLLHEHELIILDEPTAGVDVQSRALIHGFLMDYQKSGKTILYTSHHLDEDEILWDAVVILDEGKRMVAGSPKALIAATPDCKKMEDVFLHFTGHPVRDE